MKSQVPWNAIARKKTNSIIAKLHVYPRSALKPAFGFSPKALIKGSTFACVCQDNGYRPEVPKLLCVSKIGQSISVSETWNDTERFSRRKRNYYYFGNSFISVLREVANISRFRHSYWNSALQIWLRINCDMSVAWSKHFFQFWNHLLLSTQCHVKITSGFSSAILLPALLRSLLNKVARLCFWTPITYRCFWKSFAYFLLLKFIQYL